MVLPHNLKIDSKQVLLALVRSGRPPPILVNFWKNLHVRTLVFFQNFSTFFFTLLISKKANIHATGPLYLHCPSQNQCSIIATLYFIYLGSLAAELFQERGCSLGHPHQPTDQLQYPHPGYQVVHFLDTPLWHPQPPTGTEGCTGLH